MGEDRACAQLTALRGDSEQRKNKTSSSVLLVIKQQQRNWEKEQQMEIPYLSYED
jgi:hypothetical protein